MTRYLLLAALSLAVVVVAFAACQGEVADECRASWTELATGEQGHDGWTSHGLALAAVQYSRRVDGTRWYEMECRPVRSWARRDWEPIATFTVLQGADAWGTQRGFANGGWHEHNPLVPSASGPRAGYFAATYAGALAASYALDHLGHRKMARRLLWAAGGVEAQASAWTWRSVAGR